MEKQAKGGERRREGMKSEKEKKSGDLPGGPGLRLLAPSAGGPGSIPGQGARSHMLQLIPRAAK